MSYIPLHKRHSKDMVRPSPVPDSLVTKFKKNIDLKSISAKANSAIAYSTDAISKWFLFGSNGTEDEVHPSLKLVPVSSSDSAECRYGKKSSLVLMNNNVQKGSEEDERTRWLLVAEKVEEDIVFAYEQAKKGMEDRNHVYVNAKLRMVARFGKILFRRAQAGPVAEYSQESSNNRIFYTDVPTSFIQNIKSKAIPSNGFSIDVEKEIYIVMVSHYTRPHATIRCKCTVKEDGSLRMYKAEINLVRHLVIDVNCIDKNLDMRFMLGGKRKKTLNEKEMSNIQGLLDSATVDPNVKGGLRWPIGKTLCENGYRILEVCHVSTTIYKNRTLGLRIRETDRFNVRYETREIERGAPLILKEMNAKLQEQSIERGYVLEMLRDALGTIWDFLCCDANPT